MADNLFFLCFRCGDLHEVTGVSVRYPRTNCGHKDRCAACGKQELGYTYMRRSDYKRLQARNGGRKLG